MHCSAQVLEDVYRWEMGLFFRCLLNYLEGHGLTVGILSRLLKGHSHGLAPPDMRARVSVGCVVLRRMLTYSPNWELRAGEVGRPV